LAELTLVLEDSTPEMSSDTVRTVWCYICRQELAWFDELDEESFNDIIYLCNICWERLAQSNNITVSEAKTPVNNDN